MGATLNRDARKLERDKCLEAVQRAKWRAHEIARVPSKRFRDPVFAILSLLFGAPLLALSVISLLAGSYSLFILMLVISMPFVALGFELLKQEVTLAVKIRRELASCRKAFCEADFDAYVCSEVETALTALELHRELR